MTLYDDTLPLLRELIRNACVNDLTPDSGQEIRNADTLERFFAGVPNVKIQRLEPRPGRTTIIFTVPGTDPTAEPLTLLGHTDVVPIDEPKWTKDPFGAEISDGQIWGRGAVDMLFITATQAAVTRQVAREGGLRGTLTFVGIADEEARGGLGAKWLSEEHPEAFSWKNCLSETGGSHLPVRDGSDAVVVNVGEKGAAQRRLHVHGDAGHGSIPFDRESSIVKIGEVARRIAAADLKVAKDDIWQGFVQAFRFDADTEQALLNGTDPSAYGEFGDLARFAHAVSHLTIAQTVVRAGQAINVLPSHAYLELDIRTLPGQTNDYVDEVLRTALGDLADEVEIEHLISEEATVSPTDSGLYRAIEKVLGEFFPEAPVVPIISSGGSDLRFGRRLGGVGYGFAVHARGRTLAEAMGQLHSHDEALHLEDLELTVRGYDALVREFLG
ncbi:Succinyl-diaminopimelate desuccinylase [Corynebacterium faecale]|uniref:M20/M25/M40 family metallo-hydrolase n=1 Tax=Corynebacterium faecale TaxID=1758466 RepID=UPI0025B56067|nr:M20/M25/M40 family metallo-hydrolase [Corynebacterium faecale]WJY93253.1 Succinyl-diaminopimelate desuccinylase [Corynebacterium faecale]